MPRFRLDKEKENIFSLYQVIHPETLSNLIGTKIDGLEQEVPHNGKKIDIHGWANEINQNIYVEVQLLPADTRHMETMKKILGHIDHGTVIWEALTFDRRQHLIEEVVEFTRVLKIPVDILFVEISPYVIPIIEQLATFYPLNVIPNIDLLSKVRMPLTRIAKYKGTGEGGEQDDLLAVYDSINKSHLDNSNMNIIQHLCPPA